MDQCHIELEQKGASIARKNEMDSSWATTQCSKNPVAKFTTVEYSTTTVVTDESICLLLKINFVIHCYNLGTYLKIWKHWEYLLGLYTRLAIMFSNLAGEEINIKVTYTSCSVVSEVYFDQIFARKYRSSLTDTNSATSNVATTLVTCHGSEKWY